MPRNLKQFNGNISLVVNDHFVFSSFSVKLHVRTSCPPVVKALNVRQGQILQGIQDLW